MGEELRTVIAPAGTVIKIEGVPFILNEDAKIRGNPGNIAVIWDSVKKVNPHSTYPSLYENGDTQDV